MGLKHGTGIWDWNVGLDRTDYTFIQTTLSFTLLCLVGIFP